MFCLIHIIYTTSRRILTYCWETWWREGLISSEVTCWRTSPLWQSSDIACLSCLSHLTLYTLALAFSNLCIFSCYIYNYIVKMHMHKNTCTVYVICLQNITKLHCQHHSTEPNLPGTSGGTHHRITPPQWVQHASSQQLFKNLSLWSFWPGSTWG